MTRKRKTHTDKDIQFMERIYVQCTNYIPIGIKPHDILCGFYSAIQFHNEKITEQEHIKAFIKASREKPKDHYNWFTENKGV